MAEPITLAEAIANLRVDSSDEDALIEALIIAAREYVENYTGLLLVAREVRDSFDGRRPFELSGWPVADDATVAISYLDDGGTSQPLLGYRLSTGKRPARLLATSASGSGFAVGPDAVWATYMAGYPTPADVPQALKQAMLLLVGHWYGNREAVNVGNITSELPFTVQALLAPYRLLHV
jgi:uncharacterized phiE125 gp8 family phage protein